MDRFRTDTQATPIRQVEAYWTALRDGAAVPRRSQIDPRGIENVLEYAFILERIAPGLARFRIAGSHLTALAGMEVRGMPITSMFTAGARAEISAALEHCLDTPAVVEMHLSAEIGMGKPALEGQMILLPLKSDQDEISRVFGAMVTRGTPGRTPRRFDLSHIDLRNVTGATPMVTTPVRAPVAGFAEPQTTFETNVPHLRLVRSDD
jgi:hypothetical protein